VRSTLKRCWPGLVVLDPPLLLLEIDLGPVAAGIEIRVRRPVELVAAGGVEDGLGAGDLDENHGVLQVDLRRLLGLHRIGFHLDLVGRLGAQGRPLDQGSGDRGKVTERGRAAGRRASRSLRLRRRMGVRVATGPRQGPSRLLDHVDQLVGEQP
jgi:hypothetical protein